MTQEITNKALQWAYLSQRENPEDREQAKRILEELIPLFAEEARIKRWSNMRPGKEPRML